MLHVAAVPQRQRQLYIYVGIHILWTTGPIPRNTACTAVQGMLYMRHGFYAGKHSLSVKGPDCSYGLSHGALECMTLCDFLQC